jgi:hypothetical protein
VPGNLSPLLWADRPPNLDSRSVQFACLRYAQAGGQPILAPFSGVAAADRNQDCRNPRIPGFLGVVRTDRIAWSAPSTSALLLAGKGRPCQSSNPHSRMQSRFLTCFHRASVWASLGLAGPLGKGLAEAV